MKPQRSSLSKLRSGSQVRGVQLKSKKNELNTLITRTGIRTNKKTEDGQSQDVQSSSPIIGKRRNCARGKHLVALDSNLMDNEGKNIKKSQPSRNISVATPKTNIRKATTNSESSRKEALLRRSSRQASRERRVWSKQRLQKRQLLTKSGNPNKVDNAFASTTNNSIGIIKRKAGRPPKRVLAVDGDKESDKRIDVLSTDASLVKHTDPSEKRLGLRTGVEPHHRTRGLMRNNPKQTPGSPTRSSVITSEKTEVRHKSVVDNEYFLNEELINTKTINPAPDSDTDVNSDTEKKANVSGVIGSENAFVFTNTKEEDDTASDSSMTVSSVSAVLDRDGQPLSILNVINGSAPKTELKNREQEKFDKDVLLTSLIIRESLQAPSLLTKAISPFSCHEIGSKSLLPGKSMSSGVLSMGSVKNRTSFSSVGKSKLRSAISNRMGFTNYLKSKKEKDSVKAVSKLISLRRKQIGIVRENAAERSLPSKNEDLCDDSNQQGNGTGPSASRTNHKISAFNKSSTQHPNLGLHQSSLQEVQKIDAASSLLRKFRLNNVKSSARGRSSKIIDLNALRKRNLTSSARKKTSAGTMSSVSKPGKAESSDLKKTIVGDATDAAISNIRKDWDDEPSPNKLTMLQNLSNKPDSVKEEACGNIRINADDTQAHGVKFDCPVDYSPDLPISSTISKLQARVQSKSLGGDFQRLGGQSAIVAFKNSNLLGKRSDLGFDEEGLAARKKFKPSSATNSPHQLNAALLPTIDCESSVVPQYQTSPNSTLGVANSLLSLHNSREPSTKTASPVEENLSKNETINASSNFVVTGNHSVELVPSTDTSEAVTKNSALNSIKSKNTPLNSPVLNLRQAGASPVCSPELIDSSMVSANPLKPSLGPLSPGALQDGKVSLFAALAQLVEADDDESGGSDAKQTLTIHPAHKNSTDDELISAGGNCDGALLSVGEREADQAALQNNQSKAKASKELIRNDSLPYVYSCLEKDSASDIFPMTVESSSSCFTAVEAAAPKTGVVPWTSKEAGHLGVVEPESSDSSDQSDDEEKENDDCLVSSAAHLQTKKQVPSLIRVPHRPLMIKTPLKCPECPMQFCTVRSLLWHFGIHVSGDSNNNDRVPVLQGLQMPWDRMPAVPSAAAAPAAVTPEGVYRNNSGREGELTVACRRAPLPPCHPPSVGLEKRETVVRPGRIRATAGQVPHGNFNGEVVDVSTAVVPFMTVAAEHRQLNDATGLPIEQNSLSVDGDSSSDVEVLDNDWDRSVQQNEVTRPGNSFSRTPLQSIRGKRNHAARGSGTHAGSVKGSEGLRLESNPFKYCSPFNSSTGRGDASKTDKPRGGRSSSSQGLNVSNPLTGISAGKRSRKAAAVMFPKGEVYSNQLSSSQVITHNTPLFSTSTGVVATVLGTHTIETKVADNLRPLDLVTSIPLVTDQSLMKDRRDKPEKNDVILKIPIPRLNKTSASSNTCVQGPSNLVKETTKFVNIRPKVSTTVASSGAGSGVSSEGNSKRPGDGGQSSLRHQASPLRSPRPALDGSPILVGSLHPRGPAPSLPTSNNTVSIRPLKKLAPNRTIAPFKNIAAKQPALNKCLASGKGPTSTQTLISPKNPATFRSQSYNKKTAPPVVATPLNSSFTISSTYSPFLSGLSKSNFSPHLSQRGKELLSSAGVPLTAVSLPCGASSPMHSVTDHLDACGNSDGIVMINPSLGLRIVTRSNTSTVDTVTSRPIMSSSIPDTNCLTFVPDSGYNSLTIVPQVGSEPPSKRYNSSPKTPDILTIVPQMDHSKGGTGSPGRRSSLSAPTQIMTAAGKVSASQAVKLVLLPQQDNTRGKTNSSTAKSPEASTSNFGDQRLPKRTISPVVKSEKKHVDSCASGISSFRRGGGQRKSSCTDLEEDDSDDGGMVIDDEKNVDDEQRDGMDPMTLCSVTMEDDSMGPDSGLASLSTNMGARGRSASGGRSCLASSAATASGNASLTQVTSGLTMTSANVVGLASAVSGQQMQSPEKSSGFSPVATLQAVASSVCQPMLSDSGRRLPLFTTSSNSLQTSGGYVVSSTAPSLLAIRCENSNTISRENSEPSSTTGSLISMALPLVSLGQPLNYVSKEFKSTASPSCSNVSLTNTNVSLISSETCSLNNSFCRPLMTNSINTIVSSSNLAMVSNSMVPLVNNSILPLITSSSLPVGGNSIVPLSSSNNLTIVPSSGIPLVSSPNVLPLLCTGSSNSVPFVSNSRVPLASAPNTDYPILFVAPNVPALSTGAMSSLSLQNMTNSTVPSSSAVNTGTVVFTNSTNASPPCSTSSRTSLGPGDQDTIVGSSGTCVGLAEKSSASASSSPSVSCAAQASSTDTNSGAEQSCRSHSEDSLSLPEKDCKAGEVSPENGGGGRQSAPADRSKYESRKYVCQFCGRRFGWSTDLKRHVILHTGEKPFKCGACGTAFTRKFLLQNHMKRMHQDEGNASDLWSGEK